MTQGNWSGRADAKRTVPTTVMAQLMALISNLGYAGDPGYFDAARTTHLPNYRHPIQQAVEAMGVVGCFGFLGTAASGRPRYTPVTYVAAACGAHEADEIHRAAWSQGIVPLLLVATPEGLQLRNGFRFRQREDESTVPWAEASRDGVLHRTLAPLAARRLRGSVGWRDFAAVPHDRVDSRLMEAIRSLGTAIRARSPTLADKPALINAVIARFIYLFVLVDRGVVDQAWVDGLLRHGAPACPTVKLEAGVKDVHWAADETWTLLDAIDDALNGTIFPVTASERQLIGEDILHDVRRVVRNGDVLVNAQRQSSFLDVSFATLRTETMSAIYELFLNLGDPTKQQKDGAFYTPPFVADYVLDELDAFAPLSAGSRVLDPAAGSGVFLVGAFRRIVEAATPLEGWTLEGLPALRTLLTDCIYGVERDPQATNVARLSLYLTVLDYAGGATLTNIQAALGGERLFPPLDSNIACRDFFDNDVGCQPVGSFTHVVGNPPWGKLGASEVAARTYHDSLKRSQRPVDYHRVEELFVWKVLDQVVTRGGAIALLLSTRCFVNAGARRFPGALAREVELVGLTNLSHLRYRLFEHARNPATVVFALAQVAEDLTPAWVFAPLLVSQPTSVVGAPWSIVADPGSLSYVRHGELRESQRAWSRTLMLQPFDRRNAVLVAGAAASKGATFEAFLKAAGMFVTRGTIPSETNLPIELVLTGRKTDPRYYRAVLDLETKSGELHMPMKGDNYALGQEYLNSLNERQRRMFGGIEPVAQSASGTS